MSPLMRLLYISRALCSSDDVAAIAELAQVRNKDRGICGALIYTGSYFAQVIEGSSVVIDELMAKIAVDTRHRAIDVVLRECVDEKRFVNWSMAYSGPSFHTDRLVRATMAEANETRKWDRCQRLLEVMLEQAGPLRLKA